MFVINLLVEQLHRHDFLDEYSGAFGCGVGHGLRGVVELELISSTITQVVTSGVRFYRIIGRNAILQEHDKIESVRQVAKFLQPDGIIVLAEAVPRHTQRLYRLLDSHWLDAGLYQRLAVAEEAIYASESDALVNWDAGDLRTAFETAGLAVEIEISRGTHPTPSFEFRAPSFELRAPSFELRAPSFEL